MRVPAADVHKADIEAIAHQPGHASRHEFETLRRHGTAAGRVHLCLDCTQHVVAHGETVAYRLGHGGLAVHGLDDPALPRVDGLPPDSTQGHVGYLGITTHGDGQLIGKRNRFRRRCSTGPKHVGQSIEKT